MCFEKFLCLHYCKEEIYQVVWLNIFSNNLVATGDDCVWAQLLQHVWLFAILWTVARQAPLSMGILQERILQRVAVPASTGSFQPRDSTRTSSISCIGRWPLSHYCHLGSPHITRIQYKKTDGFLCLLVALVFILMQVFYLPYNKCHSLETLQRANLYCNLMAQCQMLYMSLSTSP